MTISDANRRETVSVSWIPAHPVYGAISMRRYWQALNESVQGNDYFRIHSIIEPQDICPPAGLLGSGLRFWQRQFAYPARIRRKFCGEIGHVLDHSWADMLPHLPFGVMKVVTVHDLIPLRFPGELTAAQSSRFDSWVSFIRSADAVIAVSEYTKSEIQHFLTIPKDRIHVVPNGVDIPGILGIRNQIKFPGKYGDFLNVGSIGSTILRKNLAILPAAFAKYAEYSGKRIRLVRVGSFLPVALATEIRRVIGADSLIELGHLSDSEVGQFYQSVDVIVVPSLSEGFGLPVLESLAHGTPVICSNTTSLPEVGGDEALYFNPEKPDELAARLREVAEFGNIERLRTRLCIRASRFSWRSSLEGIFEVYAKILHKITIQ